MPSLRLTTITTAAVFFLCLGTFISVSVQGAYQVLFAIPLIYYTWRAMGRGFKLPASSWWLLAFTVVAALSIAVNWGDIPKPSKNIGRLKYYLFAAFGVFPVGVWLKHVSDRVKRRLLRTLTLAVAVGGLYCAYQVLVAGAWKARPFTETMRYSYGVALVLVLWGGLFLHREKVSSWFSWRWSAVAIIGLVLSTVFVQSRGAQGALILALPVMLFFWNRKIGMAAILVGGLGMGFLGYNYLFGTQTQSSIKILKSSNNESDQTRRSQWQSAWIAAKERPFLGWGLSNFHTQVKRIKIENDLAMKNYDDAHAHNVPLEIAAGTGFIGLFFFLGWFLIWMWECWQAGGLIRAIMMPFFVAVIFEAQFEVILDANNATWISFLYALSLARDKRFQLSFA
jgi:O-antigen ligase